VAAPRLKHLRLPRAQKSGIDKFVDGQIAISRILGGQSAREYRPAQRVRSDRGAGNVALRCHTGVYCTGLKTNCDKLRTDNSCLWAGEEKQVSPTTHIHIISANGPGTGDEITHPK